MVCAYEYQPVKLALNRELLYIEGSGFGTVRKNVPARDDMGLLGPMRSREAEPFLG